MSFTTGIAGWPEAEMAVTARHRRPAVGSPVRGLVHTRTALLTVVWGALMAVWAATCAWLGTRGAWQYGALAAADVALLVILYLAEGMELAATDLLDKDPEQVVDRSVRAVLRDIQARPGFFYANRQVFVVVVIAFMTQTTTYPAIFVPGAGIVDSPAVRLWFTFLLTTLTVLWFAQVTPKRLAIVNSELFLRQSRVVWLLIRWVGWLGVTNPTDLMVAAARRWTAFRERRLLLPSRARLYSIQARLHGYALDRLSTTVMLGRGSSTSVRKRFLVLLLHGPHWETYGALETPEPLRRPRVRVLGLFRAAVPEQLDALATDLDEVFECRPRGNRSALMPVPLDDWRHEVEIWTEAGAEGRRTAYWVIHGECLPESYQGTAEAVTAAMVALLYEVEARYGLAAAGEPETSWTESVELSCRLLTMEARAAAGSRLAVVARGVTATLAQSRLELTADSGRLSRQALASRGAARVAFPLLGATYALQWSTVRGRAS